MKCYVKPLLTPYQLEISELTTELEQVNNQLEDNRDKELIRKLRKDVEELRQKLHLREQESEELRNERDRARDEKNELLIK